MFGAFRVKKAKINDTNAGKNKMKNLKKLKKFAYFTLNALFDWRGR